jgi:hypothetical protein
MSQTAISNRSRYGNAALILASPLAGVPDRLRRPRFAARREGVTLAVALSQRHERRAYWRALGDELRAHDPAFLVRQLLTGTNIICGVRARIEMQAIRDERMLDIVYWIDRPGIPEDPTLEFGPELCDVIVPNWWDLPSYHQRWRTIAGSLLSKAS